jgi:outer membrane protein assembly factor BamB
MHSLSVVGIGKLVFVCLEMTGDLSERIRLVSSRSPEHEVTISMSSNVRFPASCTLFFDVAPLTHLMFVCSTLLSCCSISLASSPTWSQFRGPNAAGVARESSSLPTEFGPDKNVVWKAELPSGASSPCIWDNHIYLTGYTEQEQKLEVLCIDCHEGSILWRDRVPAKQIEKTHGSSTPASATPACDGERVYFYFGSYGLLCYDTNGKRLWDIQQPIPQTRNGSGTSPVVVGDLVLLNREERQESYLLAVDCRTGETVWKHEHVFQPGILSDGYSTPIAWNNQVIVHTHAGVRAFDIANGALLWQVNARTTGCSTPVLGGDYVYVATWNNLGEPDLRPKYPTFEELVKEHDVNGNGVISFDEFPRDLVLFDRPEGHDEPNVALPIRAILGMFDDNKDQELTATEWSGALARVSNFVADHGLLAIKLGGNGDVTRTHAKVIQKQSVPEVPSPLYHDGRVYMVKSGGVVSCFRADTGKRLFMKRVPATGSYFSSPVAAGKYIYFTSAQGKVTVVRAADRLEVVSVNDVGERTLATPAIADSRLYVRTNRHLYAFEE